MPRYELVWVQHAEEQYNSLPPAARQAVMGALAEILQDPTHRGTYDKKADNYIADFRQGGVSGMIVYAVAERQLKILVLRISAVA